MNTVIIPLCALFISRPCDINTYTGSDYILVLKPSNEVIEVQIPHNYRYTTPVMYSKKHPNSTVFKPHNDTLYIPLVKNKNK